MKNAVNMELMEATILDTLKENMDMMKIRQIAGVNISHPMIFSMIVTSLTFVKTT